MAEIITETHTACPGLSGSMSDILSHPTNGLHKNVDR